MSLPLPHSFRFSWRITVTCLVLASVMIWCAQWQWGRYLKKTELVETYASKDPAVPFPIEATGAEEFEPLLNRRVRVRGSYDFERQVIVTNKKHVAGPGHWLLTPLKLEGQDRYVIVSRGFIPFADLAPESWMKYNFQPEEELNGVLKQAITPHALGPKNPPVGTGIPFQRKWFFEEIAKMQEQLPYPVITSVYLQRIGGPPVGLFPAEAISIEIPPSTHFGYTIEWSLLALATLLIGFLLQAFPRRRSLANGLQQLSI